MYKNTDSFINTTFFRLVDHIMQIHVKYAKASKASVKKEILKIQPLEEKNLVPAREAASVR